VDKADKTGIAIGPERKDREDGKLRKAGVIKYGQDSQGEKAEGNTCQ
jgi:hypothetical protein